MAEAVKRRYDGTRRQAQARETRRAVLRAAHDLFVSQGYARTTVAEVAAAAGVSVETVYGAFRTKATLLHRVWDVTIGGDDADVVFHERPEVQVLRDEPDLARRFRMQAAFYSRTARRVTPFLRAVEAAAGADETAAQMLAEIHRQRLEGLGHMAREAAATGQLAVDEVVCRDVVWAMTDGALWQRLVQEQGWSDEELADLLARTWIATLVRAPADRPG